MAPTPVCPSGAGSARTTRAVQNIHIFPLCASGGGTGRSNSISAPAGMASGVMKNTPPTLKSRVSPSASRLIAGPYFTFSGSCTGKRALDRSFRAASDDIFWPKSRRRASNFAIELVSAGVGFILGQQQYNRAHESVNRRVYRQEEMALPSVQGHTRFDRTRANSLARPAFFYLRTFNPIGDVYEET
jgi:hypothetical protein